MNLLRRIRKAQPRVSEGGCDAAAPRRTLVFAANQPRVGKNSPMSVATKLRLFESQDDPVTCERSRQQRSGVGPVEGGRERLGEIRARVQTDDSGKHGDVARSSATDRLGSVGLARTLTAARRQLIEPLAIETLATVQVQAECPNTEISFRTITEMMDLTHAAVDDGCPKRTVILKASIGNLAAQQHRCDRTGRLLAYAVFLEVFLTL